VDRLRRLKRGPPRRLRGGRREGEPVGRAGAAFAACVSGGRDVGPGQIAVFESVGVAFEREDFGVVDEPVDRGGGDDVVVVVEDLAQAENGLLLVTISEARS
jgi:hypothetical protein